jgi:hypothetical protein
MRKSSGSTHRKFRGDESVSTTVNDLIIGHYGHLASKRKILANDAAVKIRTAENWLRCLCVPQADNLKALCESNPEFRRSLIEWLEGSK